MATTGIQADIYAIYDERERVRAYRARQLAVFETTIDTSFRRESAARSATAARIDELATEYMHPSAATGALSDVEQMLVELNELRMEEEERRERIESAESELRTLMQRVSASSAQVGGVLGDVARVRSELERRELSDAEVISVLEGERDAARAAADAAALREARAVIAAWDLETARVVREVGREYEGRIEAAAPAAATAHSSLDSDVERYTAEARARARAIAGDLSSLAVLEFRGCVRPALERLDRHQAAYADAGLQLSSAKAELRAALAGVGGSGGGSGGGAREVDVAALLAALPQHDPLADDGGGGRGGGGAAAEGVAFAPQAGSAGERGVVPLSSSASTSGGSGAGTGSIAPPSSRGRPGGPPGPARSVAAGLASLSAPSSPGFLVSHPYHHATPATAAARTYEKATTSSSHRRSASIAADHRYQQHQQQHLSRPGGSGSGGGHAGSLAASSRQRGGGAHRTSSVPPPPLPRRGGADGAASSVAASSAAPPPRMTRPGPTPPSPAQPLPWWSPAPDPHESAEARDAAAVGLAVPQARAELRRLTSRVLERWAALPGYDAAEAAAFVRSVQAATAPALLSRASDGGSSSSSSGSGADASLTTFPAVAYRQEAQALRSRRLDNLHKRQVRLSVLLSEYAAEERVAAQAAAALGTGGAATGAEARRRMAALEPHIQALREWLATHGGEPIANRRS